MNARVDSRQTVVDVLFIVAESIVWYIMLRVGATAMEQSYLTQIEDRVRQVSSTTDLANSSRVTEVLGLIEGAFHAEYGPGLLIVLATAFGGFYLMRGLLAAGFDGVLGAVVLLAASVIGLNVLLHLALVGDARVWDPSGIADLFGGPQGSLSDLGAFLQRPDLARPQGATVGFEFIALIMMWARFIVAARSRVTFDRMLRSFTAGFAFTIVGLALAAIEGVRAAALFAVPQFIVGMLGLAVANNARTVAPADGARRVGPWIASVGGTVAMLLAVALLLGTLAFLNVGVLLTAIGDIAWAAITTVLLAIVTPIFWVIEGIFRFFIGPSFVMPTLPNLDMTPPPDIREQAEKAAAEAGGVPLWMLNSLRFGAVAAISWVIYRLALLVMRRRGRRDLDVDESRAHASSGTGLVGVLRGMMARVRGSADDAWLRRQSIYRLYARAATAAEERGFRYRLGETPIEFTTRADRAMTAPSFPPIGIAFDRARYGRHVLDEGQVRSMAAAFALWETATPPTEELRQRLAGSEPLSATQEFMLNWTARRRAIAGVRSRRSGAPVQQPSDDTSKQSGEQVI